MISARDNPFATRCIEAMGYIPQDLPWDWIDLRLEQLHFTAAIIGPHGSGKTTLLRHLQQRCSQQGKQTAQLFISEDITLPWKTIWEQMLSLSKGGILFFDGASHLSWLRWQQVRHQAIRQKIGLVITSHRRGLLPSLIEHTPQPQLLIDLVEHLSGPQTEADKQELERLFTRYQGNLRDCLRHLYDVHSVSAHTLPEL